VKMRCKKYRLYTRGDDARKVSIRGEYVSLPNKARSRLWFCVTLVDGYEKSLFRVELFMGR